MNWSREKPTQPGWYWLKENSEFGYPCIVRLSIDTSGWESGARVILSADPPHRELLDASPDGYYLWAGPLVPPGEEA